jgi:hypothetical protein
MTTNTIKRGDTARAITDTLLFGGAAINLTGATVLLILRNKETQNVIPREATVVSAVAGTVSATLEDEDTEHPGAYYMEWEITFGDGRVLSVPDNDYDELIVLNDLNP